MIILVGKEEEIFRFLNSIEEKPEVSLSRETIESNESKGMLLQYRGTTIKVIYEDSKRRTTMDAIEFFAKAKAICYKHKTPKDNSPCTTTDCPFILKGCCLANTMADPKEAVKVVEQYIKEEKARKEKLNPCPFCGGASSMDIYRDPYGQVGIVGCKSCAISYKTSFDSHMADSEIVNHLLKIWNRRTNGHDQN